MTSDKAQMPNEAQSSNCKRETVLRFRRLDFVCHLDFDIWVFPLEFGAWDLSIYKWVSKGFRVAVSANHYNCL